MRLLIVALMLAGCAPKLAGANGSGGQVKWAMPTTANRTFALAQAHCAQFGKDARMAGGDLMIAKVARFECVAK